VFESLGLEDEADVQLRREAMGLWVPYVRDSLQIYITMQRLKINDTCKLFQRLEDWGTSVRNLEQVDFELYVRIDIFLGSFGCGN
jgi:hypothetical protein